MFNLNGTIEEKILMILEKAGWYPGRRENIDEVIQYYNQYGITLTEKARNFISEYYKIKEYWYFDTDKTNRGPDFEFMLFPYPKKFRIDAYDYMYDDVNGELESEEYAAVKEYETNVCMIGEIGYYYPARVWIGDSGKILCTHEYDEEVLIFDNVIELIRHEITAHEPNMVSLIKA